MENKIYGKLISILQEVDAIGKNKKNPQQGYMFRGIDDMYNAIHPLFSKHGVFITSKVVESKREERTTKSGGSLIYTIATCSFTFYAEDGSNVTSTLDGEAMDSGDKSTNKAMSTALKYALMQMFLIPTEEKLDTEYETHEVKAKTFKPDATLPPLRKPTVTEEQIVKAERLLSDRFIFTSEEERAFLNVIKKSDKEKVDEMLVRIEKQKAERESDLKKHQ